MSTTDKPHRFWIQPGLTIVSLITNVVLAISLFNAKTELDQQNARPRLQHIGALHQFPAQGGLRTIRLKNFSSRQDAVITSLEYIVRDKEFLDCIKKRHPNENWPPALST